MYLFATLLHLLLYRKILLETYAISSIEIKEGCLVSSVFATIFLDGDFKRDEYASNKYVLK